MSDTIKPHAVWFDKETKAALKEYAWSIRSNMSEVIRAAINDIIENAGDVSVLADVEGMPTANIHICVKGTQDWWDQAVAAAVPSPYSFTALVRRRIRKILHEEGFIQ